MQQWSAAFFEWGTTWLLVQRDGKIHKEDVRRVYDVRRHPHPPVPSDMYEPYIHNRKMFMPYFPPILYMTLYMYNRPGSDQLVNKKQTTGLPLLAHQGAAQDQGRMETGVRDRRGRVLRGDEDQFDLNEVFD